MNINWTTVFFQIINFLVIVWILKKYLFKPVLSAMDTREATIQARLEDASKAIKEAEEEKNSLKAKILKAEKERDAIIKQAEIDAEAEYKNMMQIFNNEIAKNKKNFETQMRNEREHLRGSIKELADNVILKTISNAMQDLAGMQIEEPLIENFITKLRAKKFKELAGLKNYYKKIGKIEVVSSFTIKPELQKEIKQILAELVSEKNVNVKFAENSEIICGVEVLCSPILISYGVNVYMNELKNNLDNGISKITNTQTEEITVDIKE